MKHVVHPFLLLGMQNVSTRLSRRLMCACILAVLAAWMAPTVRANNPHNFVYGSLSWNFPAGPITEDLPLKSAIGFSLGYKFAADRHWRFGAKGTWTQMGMGTVDTTDFTDYTFTHVGITANGQLRFNKHGWTPYVEGEAGMGLAFASIKVSQVPQRIDDLSEVRLSVAGMVGVLIPVSERLDVDVAGRYQTTFMTQRFDTIGAHLGLVFTLN